MSPTGGSHLAVMQRRGTPLSSTVAKGRGGARRGLIPLGREMGRAGAGPKQEEKGGRGEAGHGGKKKKKEWAEPKSSEGESLSLFIFCFPFLLKQNTFQNKI